MSSKQIQHLLHVQCETYIFSDSLAINEDVDPAIIHLIVTFVSVLLV